MATATPRARILVVEDELYLVEGIREILELDSYHVLTATSGIEALELMQASEVEPDLIVSDIMMPQMDGYEFFEAVRSRSEWLTIPFIFLTAKSEKSDVRHGKAMGADDYVTKPFSPEDLLIAVSSKLKRRKEIQSGYALKISELKQRILTILNHEFRTPLTYVIAYSDMLSRDVNELSIDDIKHFLRGINEGAERLRRLIESFMLLVDIETGEVRYAYQCRKRDINNFRLVFEEAMQPLQSELEHKKQTLDLSIAPNTPTIIGDFEHIAIALNRLLDNAIKFSPVGNTIKGQAYQDERGRPVLAVQDFGRGIPSQHLENIFDSFYQINRQYFEDQGAGSGLAIVRGIADVHGAEIKVVTAEGQGSTFSLHFPLNPPS